MDNVLDGITVSDGSTVIGCTARANTGIGSNTGSGIVAGSGCTIKDCTATGNAGDGIHVASACSVLNNAVTGNGNTGGAGTQGGLHATGNDNRLDGNHVIGNNCDGILVDSNTTKNVVVRNTVRGNSGFQFRIPGLPGQPPAGANVIGSIVGDATNSSANAWANFSP